MLLVVYRSIVTMLLMLDVVAVELWRPVGSSRRSPTPGVIGLSTYATNLLTLLAIAAGTDYAIFVVGRYQEARPRRRSEKRPTTTCSAGRARHRRFGADHRRGGGMPVLHPAAYFQSLGVPAALGVLVALAAALTLGPAVLVMAAASGCWNPNAQGARPGWRRIGTVIVRWPGPILVARWRSPLSACSRYRAQDRLRRPSVSVPDTAPANVGYAAAERHFSRPGSTPNC